MMSRLSISSLLFLFVTSCQSPDSGAAVVSTGPDPARGRRPGEFRHGELVAAAVKGYEKFGRVDDMNRWIPTLCILRPGVGRISEAKGATAAGGKLFYLYAKDHEGYMNAQRKPSPVGQVIVKESWTPEEIERAPRDTTLGSLPLATKEGKLYRPKEKRGLFVMMKLDPAEHPDTDEGWLYATLDAEGKSMFRCGVLEDCKSCHVRGTVDRLFGLKDLAR